MRRPDLARLPRPVRLPLYLLGGWLGVFAVVQVTTVVAGAAARGAGKDPQLRADGWPAITHLRMVGEGDDAVVFGAQPTLADYRALADQGVTTVIDLRENSPSPGNPNRDDPAALAELGIDYHPLPVIDGEAPSRDEIDEFLRIVDDADGIVFAHCSGGVGRSTTFAAIVQASRGQDPSVLEQVAVGPPTIEQMWFVGTLRPGEPRHRITPVVAVVSRVIDFPRRIWGLL
ncbi:MAG TPA: sulfur transferase domain-containing protein [Acidimicrobiales bacterium]